MKWSRPSRSLASCPLCGSVRDPIFLVSWQSLTWWHCTECDGGWREPYLSEKDAPDAETLETYDLYLRSPSLFAAIADEKSRWCFGATRPECVSVFEIGPGTGALAEALVRHGLPRSQYTAVETNPAFAERLTMQGFRVFCDSSSDSLRQAAAFHNEGKRPVIVLLDNVLEHLTAPRDFLLELRDSLTVPFTIRIEVPNEKGLVWRAPVQDLLRGARKSPTFPGHVNLFTRSSLTRLLSEVFPGPSRVDQRGLRRSIEVKRLLLSEHAPIPVHVLLALLRVLPFDLLFGVGYFLRAEARHSGSNLPGGRAEGTVANFA